MLGCRASTSSRIRTTLILSFFWIFTLLKYTHSQSTTTKTKYTTITPGRYGHCSVAWKNELYVFGGWDNYTDDQGVSTPFFYSTTIPLNVNSNITWTFLNTENAVNVGSAACVVTPQGYLLVLGGMVSLNSTNGKVSTQVYDLNQHVWIDWKNVMDNSYPGFGINPKAAFISNNILLIYAGNTGVNEDQKNSPVQFIYFLNVTKIPWTWTEVRKNVRAQRYFIAIYGTAHSYKFLIFQQTINAPVSNIIASAKGNAWLLGGYFLNDVGSILGYSPKIWVSNRHNQWVSPNITLPYGIRDGAIGVNKDTLFIVGFSGIQKNSSVNVFPLNLAKMRFEENITFSLKSRSGASFVQFPGSDAVLIYGGCAITDSVTICSTPFNSILIFNMTTRTWTTDYNIVTNSQLTFATITFCQKRIKSPAWHLDSIIRPSRFSRFSWQQRSNNHPISASNHGTRSNSPSFQSGGGSVSLAGDTKIPHDSDPRKRNSQFLIVPSIHVEDEKQEQEEENKDVSGSKTENYTWVDGKLTSHRRATCDIII
ncbi:13020_t:CDS:2 [Ambispora gerdemannii]|uniref:13020_t:CDS:1 n=1 Tax=Ambispora gerdemannii TaxID=144530 RepID=A0A9N9BK44_9GLOM|nr:13020_t:CDS:2 [Ambispora gerdemannii]